MTIDFKLIVLLSLLIASSAAATTKSDVDDARKVEEEGSESLTDWAKHKISEGLGFKNKIDEEEIGKKAGEKAKDVRGAAKETASAAERAEELKDRTCSAGKDGACMTSEKAGEMKDAATEKTASAKESAKEKAKEGYDATMRAKEEAGKKASEAKENAKETLDSAKEKIASGYEAAKEKVVGGSHNREDEL